MERNIRTLGVCRLGRPGLERSHATGDRLRVRVTGVLVIAGDVPPDLAAETIEDVQLRGLLVASPPVRRALAARLHRRGVA